MSPSSGAKTLPNRAARGVFFCDVLANLQLHLQHKVDLERIAEIWDLRSSGL